MTPLAMKYLRAMANEPERRAIHDPDNMIDRIGDLHCFEMSAVAELAETVWSIGGAPLISTAFLPADETWLEFKGQDGPRVGFYAKAVGGGDIEFFKVGDRKCWRVGALHNDGKFSFEAGDPADEITQLVGPALKMLLTFLAIINTPKLVDRRDHQAHRGLQRELRKSNCAIELRPWTEIRLEMTPRRASGDAADPSRLSGRKCLHFCRSHLRIQNGRLVVVRPHWRGDVALGVMQSDYRVAA